MLIETFEVDRVMKHWRNFFEIPVVNEFQNVSSFSLVKCKKCGLQFFYPKIVGSEGFYRELQKFDWYYMRNKWEHKVALQDLKSGFKVLEVGCGFGDFMAQAQKKGIDIEGIELNKAAVRVAKDQGLSVRYLDLKEILKDHTKTYDAVCSFQVLEHILDPKEFFKHSIMLLKQGGKLIISVPNADSFIQYAKGNLLDQPPHHISRWSKRVFEVIPKHFPLALQRVLYEPLASYHLEWYVDIQLNRLLHVRFLTGFVYRLIRKLVLTLTRRTGWYRFLRGHSIYVCFQKINSLS